MIEFSVSTNTGTEDFTLCIKTPEGTQTVVISRHYLNKVIGLLVNYRHSLTSKEGCCGDLEAGVVASHLHSHLVSGD